MRLTPEVMAKSQTHLNALKERELELRGLQIPLIENLASHLGTYDTLNLTDNALISLINIPLAPRIRAIHVGLNNISSIAPNLATSVPHLETLILNSNSLASLSALLPLANCQKLEHLSLIGNPVRSEKHYREWLIWKLGKTNLRVLDYKRIKDAERASAKSLFEDAETGLPSQLAHSLTSEAATNAANAAANAVLAQSSTGASKNANGPAARSMTEDEKARVREAIKGASSIEEVKRLQRMLAEGKVPEGQAV